MEGFSRHTQAHVDARAASKSMVEKHAEAQKNAMQEACLGALRRAVPSASAETCLFALQATDWDADAAFNQLRSFMTTQPAGGSAGGGGVGRGGGAGGSGGKKGKRKSKKDSKKHKRRKGDSSDSDDSDDPDSDASSDSDSDCDASSSSSSSGARKKSGKKQKKDKKDKGDKRKKKDAKKPSKEKRKKTKESSSKRKKPKLAGPVESFGARGFLRETDKYDKEGEFRAWLEEVKKQSLESLAKWEEKELFKEFAEDHNTSTLPHEKYYDLESWAKREAQRLREAGGHDGGERTAFDDEAERKKEIATERERRANEYKREAYVRMKKSGDLENLKAQERLKEMKQFAYNIGDMDTVAKVNKTLAPGQADANYGFKPS